MDIRIGIVNVARELRVEVDDAAAAGIVAAVESVSAGKSKVLWLDDSNGRRVAVPADKLAYVDIGPSGERRIGFAGT